MCKTVEELGLTPSGSLVLQKKEIKQAVAETSGIHDICGLPAFVNWNILDRFEVKIKIQARRLAKICLKIVCSCIIMVKGMF